MNHNHRKLGFFATRFVFVAIFAVVLLSSFFVAPASAAIDGWHIKDDATGGECSTIGNWDAGSKTCTLSQDLSQGIIIDNDGITLDGNGHTLTGGWPENPTYPDYGIYLYQKTNATIKNVVVSHHFFGIFSRSSSENVFKDNTTRDNTFGIFLTDNSNNNTLEKNAAFKNAVGLVVYTFSEGNTIIGNTVDSSGLGIYLQSSSNNTLHDNTISNNGFYGGVNLALANDNKIYNNNFINNEKQVEYRSGSNNLFHLAVPVGGNYWSNYSTPAQGCADANSDGFCDAPYVFTGGKDNLPWTKRDGWFAPSNHPPTFSFPTTVPYAEDGIDPNKGTIETEFAFKTVYTDADNDAPVNISLVVGDGMATTTHALALDTLASVDLRDGNYVNGEQFTATSTFSKKAHYFYHFEASDGKGGTARMPTTGELPLSFVVINVPVIIVPGIMGSELFGQSPDGYIQDKVWITNDPFFITSLSKLSMQQSGKESELLLTVGDAIRKDMRVGDVLDSLISILANLPENKYEEGKDLFIFSYDWRFNIITSAVAAESSLKAEIESIKNQTGAQKIDIIAHSQGGLLAKLYTAGHGNVRKFIDIATPHLGAPKAFKALMWGDDLGTKFPQIAPTIQMVSQNMPSIYQLLPSEKYIAQIGPYFNDMFDMDKNGVKGWLDYPHTTDFLVHSGRNTRADTWSRSIHNFLDNWDGKQYGVEETTNIIGCGAATIGSINALNKKDKKINKEEGFDVEYMLRYTSGDGTVPYKSAESLLADKTYYASNVLAITNGEESNLIEHSTLPSLSGVRQLIPLILNGHEPSFTNNPFLKINKNSSECTLLSGKTVSFHSPIELHIYDSQGRHTGSTSEGFIENNIPGVQYDVIEDNKFVFLPDGETYTVTGQATGVGTFNARITTYENNEITETRYYNEIPLKALETNTIFRIVPNQTNYTIQIDQDGNGIFESQVQPSSVLNTEESQDLIKPETITSLSGTQGRDGWYISEVEVGFSATDDNSGILKTEYSLDNGKNWNIYQQPFTIATEGTTSILYLSTDRAGNYELLKSQIIKIDKTPPEAKISFDSIIKQLKVGGVDNLSSVAVAQNGTMYTLTDEAGHTLAVDFEKLKTEGKEIKAEILTLRYDGILAPIISENMLQYEWSLEKDESLKELNQRVKIEKNLDVHVHYDTKKNETTINTKMGDDKDEKKTMQTFLGLILFTLTTDSGNFDIKYDH